MPLVLLLAGTVAVTPECGGLSDDCCDIILDCLVLLHVRADLLVDGLLELLVVEDGPHLTVAVARPVRRGHLRLGLAHVGPGGKRLILQLSSHHHSLGVVLLGVARELCLSPGPLAGLAHGDVVPPLCLHGQLLLGPLHHVPPEPPQGLGGHQRR